MNWTHAEVVSGTGSEEFTYKVSYTISVPILDGLYFMEQRSSDTLKSDVQFKHSGITVKIGMW